MGLSGVATDQESEEAVLLTSGTTQIAPKDSFHLAYIFYFFLGAGYLFPWNAYITAVDYFSYIYPDKSVDRVFTVVYMVVSMVCIAGVVLYARNLNRFVRINVGLLLFLVSLVVVPVMDLVYVKGEIGMYSGYYVTIGGVVVSGVADGLVQGGVVGSAGELPQRYMQAVIAGTAASGVLVSILRIITKSAFSQDAHGLRGSANLYFTVGIVFMAICIIFYNLANQLPVLKYYKELKMQAISVNKIEKKSLRGSAWRSSLWEIVGRVKLFGFGLILIYTVTMSIFPGYVTEDVHSEALKDWYPIILITCCNVFDLVGKSLTGFYLIENKKLAVGACVGRFMFFPLFLGCLHGPEFFRSEIPVTILTCLLGLTNGYFTSVLMILAPKELPIQHSETAGVVMVLFLVIGLAVGSAASWFWVI